MIGDVKYYYYLVDVCRFLVGDKSYIVNPVTFEREHYSYTNYDIGDVMMNDIGDYRVCAYMSVSEFGRYKNGKGGRSKEVDAYVSGGGTIYLCCSENGELDWISGELY